MALHRDIFWVGRQWAVTGAGLQAIDQRLKGVFDSDTTRIWDENLRDTMLTNAWLNVEDFDRALLVARARFPAPPRDAPSLVESVLALMRPASAMAPDAVVQSAEPRPSASDEIARTEPPKSAAVPIPHLRMQGVLARFIPQWRIRR
jgi:hypothetical protein